MKVLLLTTCKPDDRKTLACARALGRAGYEVHAASDRHLGEGSYSRFIRRRHLLPHPGDSARQYLNRLAELLEQHHYQAVLPTTDYTVLPLCQGVDSLPPVLLPVPPYASARLALNKWESLRLAGDLGLETPRTQLVGKACDLPRAADNFGHPFVVKTNSGAGAIGMSFHRDAGSPLRIVRADSDMVFDYDKLLLQEWLEEEEVHEACLLFHQARLKASFTQKRLRSYPPQGGAGIYNESTWRPDLVEQAAAILESLRWNGPAQVEFLVNPRTGKVRFLEINGRFWATLDLAIQAGVNFPVLACRPEQMPANPYRVGLRYRWPIPLGALHAMQSGDFWSSTSDFFLPRSDCVSDLWWSDPVPKIAECIFALGRILQRRGRLFAPRGVEWRTR